MRNNEKDYADGRSVLCRVMGYLTISKQREAHDLVKDKLRFGQKVDRLQRSTA